MTPESSTETISMPPYQSIIKLESSCDGLPEGLSAVAPLGRYDASAVLTREDRGDLQFEVGGIGAAVMVRCAAG